jgi:hypothetical protein
LIVLNSSSVALVILQWNEYSVKLFKGCIKKSLSTQSTLIWPFVCH